MSCDVTVLVSGLTVKRITAVILVKGKRPPPLEGEEDCEPPDEDDELELDDPPVPTYAVTRTSTDARAIALSWSCIVRVPVGSPGVNC